MNRPHIVFILSDDHAAHSISAYGSRVNVTSHMDRLAAEGARMDALYCTNSICSFLRRLRGEDVEHWRQAVYYRYWEHDDPEHHAPAHYGVRTPELKYIRCYDDGLGSPGSSDRTMPIEDELYDLVADPREMTNVAGDPAYAQALAEMQELTAQMQAEVGGAPYSGPDTPRLEWPTAR